MLQNINDLLKDDIKHEIECQKCKSMPMHEIFKAINIQIKSLTDPLEGLLWIKLGKESQDVETTDNKSSSDDDDVGSSSDKSSNDRTQSDKTTDESSHDDHLNS